MRLLSVSFIAFLLCTGSDQALAQHDHGSHGSPPDALGTVHFQTSCSPAVTAEFDKGMALLHSFWFSAAIDAFREVAKRDPGCAMAHWGMAMAWWGNPFGGFRPPEAMEQGAAAVASARAAGPGTARESAYIEAVALLYEDADSLDQRSRTIAYEKAMEALAEEYPDDPEAQIFYALSLDQTHLPADKTFANLLAAARILERESEAQPDHPGIAHYLIHSYDVPALAPRALDAARRYAKIAPAAPHALHMPSHTFTRVGSWDESIETNLASAAAARRENSPSEELHALDYQVYAYLQTGQDAAAKAVLESISEIAERIETKAPGNAAPTPAGYFALAAIPARYALERNAWAEAAKLEARDTPFAWVDANTHFARALGAARSGDAGAARREVAKIDALRARLEEAKDAYWAGQLAIQARAAEAWIAYAGDRKEDALRLMREAADLEDATEKSAITPGPIKPARELLAEMLLAGGDADGALREFQATLTKEPNRFRAVYGAAVAARQAGDEQISRQYFAELLGFCHSGAADQRPELVEAQSAVSG